MSKTSKTARASAVADRFEKKVIPDEVYIKNLRNDLDSGLYVAQEGARALLRAYDQALGWVNEANDKLGGAEKTLANKVIENEALYKNNQALTAELQAALSQVSKLSEELEYGAATKVECGCNDPMLPSGAHAEGCVLYRRSDG